MNICVYIAISIFSILLLYMSLKYGTQTSISQLAKGSWLILLVALCSQCLLVYPMIELTPAGLQWIPFVGCSAIVLTGLTNVLNKEDELVHIIAAFIAFVLFFIWVCLLKPVCLLPLIICSIAGKTNIKWRVEIGLIISVYMTLLLLL